MDKTPVNLYARYFCSLPIFVLGIGGIKTTVDTPARQTTQDYSGVTGDPTGTHFPCRFKASFTH